MDGVVPESPPEESVTSKKRQEQQVAQGIEHCRIKKEEEEVEQEVMASDVSHFVGHYGFQFIDGEK